MMVTAHQTQSTNGVVPYTQQMLNKWQLLFLLFYFFFLLLSLPLLLPLPIIIIGSSSSTETVREGG